MKETILVADDSIATQRLFEMALTKEGFEVIAVGSGADALDHVRQRRPDIALIDAIMPDLDGYQVCETLKHTKEFGNLPIVLLAGTFEDFDEEKSQQVGADAILNKPCKPNILVSKVKQLLQDKKIKEASLISQKPSKGEVVISESGEEIIIKEVKSESWEPTLGGEFAEEDLEVLEEEFQMGEEEVGTEEEILEPSSKEEASLIPDIEEEIFEEEPQIQESAEEEFPEEIFQEEEPVFQEEEPILKEEMAIPAPEAKAFSVEAKAARKEELTSQEPFPGSSPEKVDLLVDQIAGKLAGRLLPLLTQELANYVIKLPVMEHLIRSMSQRLVEEILPELERKK